jgi:hypothetical protein
MTFARPSAVAIHDDGDMAWQPIEMNLLGKFGFDAPRGDPRHQLIASH